MDIKIGKNEFSLKLPRFLNLRKDQELTKKSGTSGTQLMDGFILGEDLNLKFQTPEVAANEIDNMRTDPIICGLLNAYMLPMLRAEARIEPASDANIDLKIAEEVESNLFRNEHFTYQQWLRDRLLYLPYGFEVASKQFEIVNGRWRWKRWMHLKPATITKWLLDDNADLSHVEQVAFDAVSNRWVTAKIKVQKVFHIANEMEGHNFQGRSVIRSAYRSWLLKDTKMRLMGIQAERGGVGIPHIILDGGNDNKDQAIAALKKMRSHEQAYAVSSKGDWEFGFLGGKDFFGIDLIPMINLHNREMVECLNFGFLQQSKGDSAMGSNAKQVVDIDFAMMGVEGTANHLEDIVNNGNFGTQNIKQLVQLNYGRNITEFPKYKQNKISQDNVQALMDAIKSAKEAGVFRPSKGDEGWARDKLGAPEFIEELNQEVEALAPADA